MKKEVRMSLVGVRVTSTIREAIERNALRAELSMSEYVNSLIEKSINHEESN